jgi:acyl-coenzyme A synthetase/AMP-(fatty) acid ligase
MAEVYLSTSDGLEVYVMPSFDLVKFCDTIQKAKITYCNVVPRVILALAKEPVIDKYDLSSVRMMFSAAAPLSKDLIQTMYARLKIPIRQAYGLSEMSPAVHRQVS